ncbi:purple acid phosphatase family protein [Jiangella mangrovi]|uniref:Putative phosphodiesterase n=1 Tax=Jiangella mangrovi TaxID=1524084 RepID=A0A7W9LJ19_9ACTN|nr:metallophosphoesterase family protein [Jiangella mangrovi]MBB5785519.1 putative phosphodiesterase [Jiangella mangrovi]
MRAPGRRLLAAGAVAAAFAGLLAPATFAETAADAPALVNGVYEIGTPEQLLYLSHHYGAEDVPKTGYYKLTADIDMAGITGYEPFGRFYGTFDGDFHSISNLLIDQPGIGTVGFFTHLGDSNVQAVIKNTAFLDIDVRGGQTTGAVAGMLWGTIENVYTTGSVVASDHSVGGLAGRIPVDTSGTIPEPDPAEAAIPTIRNSYSLAHVQEVGEADSQGGLAGRVLNPRTVIENSFAAGPVDGYTRVGGLVGDLRDGVLRNSVAANPIVTGGSSVNSAYGRVLPEGSAENVLAWAGMVAPAFNGEPVTESELQSVTTYESLGWDFESAWELQTATVDGAEVTYPALRGFGPQPYPFDFTSFSSPIEFSITATRTTDSTLTVEIGDVTNDGATARAAEVAIVQSEAMPGDDDLAWRPVGPQVFDGLEPATKYTFWAKVRLEGGEESGWRFAPLYTRYALSDDPTPAHISATVTEDPAHTVAINWETLDIGLDQPAVQIARTDTGNRKFETVRGTQRVQEVHMSANEGVLDGIRNFHTVHVDGLKADTEYVYRVGDLEAGVWSAEGRFRTAVGQNQDFSFLYYTDPQVQDDNAAFIRNMRTAEQEHGDEFAFTLAAGDLTEKGYAEGQLDTFYGGAQAGLSERMFLTVQGNHDRDELLDPHFDFPDTVFENVWSFDYGDAHFAVLNSDRDDPEELAAQVEWLRRDMARARQTWRIVTFHKAMYAATDHVDDEDIDRLREYWAPVFEDLRIDVVITGHDHSFSRGFVRGGADATPASTQRDGRELFSNPKAPLYIVNGTAGSSKWYKRIQYDASLFHNVAPDYSFIDKSSTTYDTVLQEQSYSVVRVTADGRLSIDTYAMKYDRDDPEGFEIEPYLYDSIELFNTLAPGRARR